MARVQTRNGLAIEPVIGLEVHVQLRTRTKMWCGCPLEFGARPNSRVCPVCLGLPGALPVMNRQAVEFALRVGLALNCRIATFSKWDRKSYYYPDLPKNYQISQYDLPLCAEGWLEFPFEDSRCRVRIRRVHLEEDAGKNVHDLGDFTGVDLNRAGTPLLEIVTEPDLHSAVQAREFAVQLQRLVRYLGVSEADMQKGHMRFEPNINVRIRCGGEEFVTPIVEVKNLNSFRSLTGAIEFEIARQVEEWQQTGQTAQSGNKTNRGWDDERLVTVPQREKEEAHDYRYFPDPDLVPLTTDPERIEALRRDLPELPIARAERFVQQFGIPARDAPALVEDRATADLLDAAARLGGDPTVLGKQFLSFWSRYANERATTIAGLGVCAAHVAELANLVREGRINATAAAQIAEQIVERIDARIGRRKPDPATGGVAQSVELPEPIDDPSLAPAALAEELGLLQTSDEGQVAAWVDEVLARNDKAVRDALSNPKKRQAARGFLTGQVMKLSGGRADPKLAARLIEQRLAGRVR